MRGFLVGTFALVVLSAFVQKDAAGNLSKGAGASAAAFQRLTDPNIAGVPLRAGVGGKQTGGGGKQTGGGDHAGLTAGAGSPTFVSV